MINIGIIGYGYWGPNLVRNCAETPGARVSWVSDLDTAKLETVRRRPAAAVTRPLRGIRTALGRAPSRAGKGPRGSRRG